LKVKRVVEKIGEEGLDHISEKGINTTEGGLRVITREKGALTIVKRLGGG
jgi:hypothetical protein